MSLCGAAAQLSTQLSTTTTEVPLLPPRVAGRLVRKSRRIVHGQALVDRPSFVVGG